MPESNTTARALYSELEALVKEHGDAQGVGIMLGTVVGFTKILRRATVTLRPTTDRATYILLETARSHRRVIHLMILPCGPIPN